MGGTSRGPRPGTTLARGLVALAGIGALAAACGLLAGSALPFEVLEPRVDALAWDGDAAPFTRASHQQIAVRGRAAAALLAVLGAVLLWRRDGAARRVALAWSALARGGREFGQSLREALAREPRSARLTLAVVSLCGLALRASFLLHPLRRDEAFTYNNFVSQPFAVALSNQAPFHGLNNHLLNTLLAKLSCTIFAAEPWAMRLPALVAGALLVPVTYAAGRVLYGRRAGLLAATLVAVSPYLIARSTDARGYAFVVLCAVSGLALAGRALERPRDAFGWGLFAVVGALGFFAIPSMLYAFAAVCLWAAWVGLRSGSPALRRQRLTGLFWAGLGTVALTLILYAPVLIVSGPAALTDNHWVQPYDYAELAALWPERIGPVWSLWTEDPALPLAAPLLLGFAASLVCHRRLARHPVNVWLAVLVACGTLLAVQRVAPWTRVWSFLLPLFLISASAGLVFALERVLGDRFRAAPAWVAALALLLLLSSSALMLRADRIYADPHTGRVYPLVDAADYLVPRLRTGDRVLGDGTPGLVFELAARGVPPAPLQREDAAARLYVLAGSRDAALARLVEHEIEPGDYGEPQRLVGFERYTPTAWYRFERPRVHAAGGRVTP